MLGRCVPWWIWLFLQFYLLDLHWILCWDRWDRLDRCAFEVCSLLVASYSHLQAIHDSVIVLGLTKPFGEDDFRTITVERS